MKPVGNYKHGHHGTLTYARWKSMKQRCNDPNAINYPQYGGRGISVCDRWKDFESFLADMGECPGDGMTMDRIDNSKGYEPGNCRWANKQTQANNKTNNHKLEWRGETKTTMEWSRITGIPSGTIFNRIRFGWSVEDALTRGPHERGLMLTHQGETLHLAEWARRVGLRYDCLSRRLAAGWDVDRALTTPSNRANDQALIARVLRQRGHSVDRDLGKVFRRSV